MTHSIIIVTRNRLSDLRILLAALAAQTVLPVEVVVVDASDTPLSMEDCLSVAPDDAVLNPKTPDVRVVADRLQILHTAPGIAAQRNVGLHTARGDILTFFDDDAVPSPDYCENVLQRFATDTVAEIGGISGSMVGGRPRGAVERLLRTVLGIQTGMGTGRFRLSGIPEPLPCSDREREVSICATTACSYRRRAVEGLGFEEYWCSGAAVGLPTGRGFGEDMLFSAEVAKRHRLVILPGARYAHHDSPRNREDTMTTQALYVFSLRYVSRLHARGRIGRCCRFLALGGQAVLNLLQALRYRDAGYIRGWYRAMRARLP